MRSHLNWVLLMSCVGVFVWGCQSGGVDTALTEEGDLVAPAQQNVNFVAAGGGDASVPYSELVDQWHGAYVEQINDLSLLDPDYDPTDPKQRFQPGSEGMFGISRMGPTTIQPGLFSVHEPKSDETTVPQSVQKTILDLGIEATVYVYGAKMGLLTSDTIRPSGFVDGLTPNNNNGGTSIVDRKLTSPVYYPVGVSPLVREALENDEDMIQESYMTTRKITLDKEECLTCHTKSKLGSTAAIFVYKIKRQESP